MLKGSFLMQELLLRCHPTKLPSGSRRMSTWGWGRTYDFDSEVILLHLNAHVCDLLYRYPMMKQYLYNIIIIGLCGIVCVHRESVHTVNTGALLTLASHPVLDKSGLAEAWLWSFDAATPAALRMAKIKRLGDIQSLGCDEVDELISQLVRTC